MESGIRSEPGQARTFDDLWNESLQQVARQQTLRKTEPFKASSLSRPPGGPAGQPGRPKSLAAWCQPVFVGNTTLPPSVLIPHFAAIQGGNKLNGDPLSLYSAMPSSVPISLVNATTRSHLLSASSAVQHSNPSPCNTDRNLSCSFSADLPSATGT